jgi:hypothetical protein
MLDGFGLCCCSDCFDVGQFKKGFCLHACGLIALLKNQA